VSKVPFFVNSSLNDKLYFEILRYEADGRALLILLPSELKMVELIRQRKIPIEEIKGNVIHEAHKHKKITPKMATNSFLCDSQSFKVNDHSTGIGSHLFKRT
jgi:hypothetical protein